MAEGFARTLGAGCFEVKSAGLEASNVNSTAVDVMREAGIDISSQTSKPLADFAFDSGTIHTGAAYNYICTRHTNMKGKLIVQ